MSKHNLYSILLLFSASVYGADVYVFSPKDKKILPYISGGDAEVRYCTDSKIKKQKRDEAFERISEYCGGSLYTITADIHAVFAPRSGAKEMLGECKGPGHVLVFNCSGTKPSGAWNFYPADGQESCIASYTHKNGTISIVSPDNELQNSSIIFSGPNIPNTSSARNVKISFSQNHNNMTSLDAINGIFAQTPSGQGSVKIAIDKFESMLDGMQDTQTFKILNGSKTWIEIDWNQGKRIKEKLTDCYVKSILHK